MIGLLNVTIEGDKAIVRDWVAAGYSMQEYYLPDATLEGLKEWLRQWLSEDYAGAMALALLGEYRGEINV